MKLKSLELTGFKSFGKKSELSFNTPITAIVGPNGSGKSNCAEAFRFVLGEQSMKSMRGKRTEDLIFNGSKDLPRSNRASVKLVFDNSRRELNVDFDEVSLERVIHRDSSSEYFVNGSSVRLKDIIELLAQAHIGSSGHHIISQGEADRVLSSNARERREMVEDALGLKIYQYKKQESLRKLDKTEENIKQVESLRREISPHLKFLKKQVEKVEKALEMRKELSVLYGEYLKREELYLRACKERINSEKSEPTHRKSKLEKELNEAKNVLQKSSTKDEKSEELFRLEGRLASVRKEKDILSRELGRIDGVISYEERRLKNEIATLQNMGNEQIALRDVEILAREIESRVEEAERESDISAIRNIFTNIKNTLRDFISNKKTKDNNNLLDSIKSEIDKLKNEKIEADKKMSEFEREENGLGRQILSLKDEIEKEKDSNRDAEKAVFRIMAEQNEVNAILQAIKVKEDKLILEETDFKREIQEGIVLVGREINSYQNIEIDINSIMNEDRSVQDNRRRVIEKIKIRLEDSGGGSGEEIMKEYKDVSERDEFLARELVDLEKTAQSLQVLIKDLESRLNIEFKEGIKKINSQFQEFFSLMFGGGQASLEIVKQEKRRKSDTDISELNGDISDDDNSEENMTEEGIDIHVALPHKKVKGLVMLSGGERALTSIALIFAMSQVNPPPFIILDETDAALDEANSRKYGEMIASLSKHSQLILITHNRETMSRAGVLYGVTMGQGGVSKLLSIAFDEAVAVAK